MGGEVREVMGGRIPWASEAFVKLWLFTLSEMGNSVRFQAEEGHPFGCVVKKSETKTLIAIIQVKHDGVWDRGGRLKIIKLTFVGFKLQHEPWLVLNASRTRFCGGCSQPPFGMDREGRGASRSEVTKETEHHRSEGLRMF